MCQACVDAVTKFFPALEEKDYSTLLYNATSFPFGSPEQVTKELEALSQKSNQDAAAAYAIAQKEQDDFEKSMKPKPEQETNDGRDQNHS